MPWKLFGKFRSVSQRPRTETLSLEVEGPIGETSDSSREPVKNPPRGRGRHLGPLVKRCQHSTMTPITQPSCGKLFECSRCKQLPNFGMIYACTVDEDRVMFDRYSRNPNSLVYDEIGRLFAKEMSLGPNGPDVRSKSAFRVVEEMTPEQQMSYTPEQLRKLVEQREQVLDSLAKAREANQSGHDKKLYGADTYPFNKRPWVPSPDASCSYKLCLNCLCLQRKAREKIYISLDAVLRGAISPALIVGCSSGFERTRLVVDVNVVRTIGCLPVPMVGDSFPGPSF
ncbi:hypothetical protein VTJ83DRAFT_1308 [Remersonia thermophila]|uniref:Uncharacterized protein n=1 Tax=Remersonia thermophila TaxID=72144 RepID=A0ABR4DQQ4_9PEZI